MDLQLVSDLTESKMFRTRQQIEAADVREVLDFAFLSMLTLYIMYSNYDAAPEAKHYAARTIQYRNFDAFRQSATDLYIALNAIKRKNFNSFDKTSIQLNKLSFPDVKIKEFLTQMSNGQTILNATAFFLQLEKGLDIQDSNYRSVRRLASDWNRLSRAQKSLVATRLMHFYRTHAVRSEIYGIFSNYAKNNNLIISPTYNPERTGKTGRSVAKAVAAGTLATGALAVGAFAAGRAFGKSLV